MSNRTSTPTPSRAMAKSRIFDADAWVDKRVENFTYLPGEIGRIQFVHFTETYGWVARVQYGRYEFGDAAMDDLILV